MDTSLDKDVPLPQVEQTLKALRKSFQTFHAQLHDIPHSFQLQNQESSSSSGLRYLKSTLESALTVGYHTPLETARARNLLAYLHFGFGERAEALDQTELVLSLEGQRHNLVSLANKAVILWHLGQRTKAEGQVQRLSRMKREMPEFPHLLIHAKAELAFSYTRCLPDCYPLARDLFSEVTPQAAEPEAWLWKFGLAFTRRRMLRPNLVPGANDQEDYLEVLRLFMDVVNGCRLNSLVAKTYAELALLLFMPSSSDLKELLQEESGLTVDQACERALELDGNDHSVLWKCGKMYRYFRDREKSCALLERAVTIRSSSKAYHNLGLTYKAMALNEARKKTDLLVESSDAAGNSDSKERTDSAASTAEVHEARAESDQSRNGDREGSAKSDMPASNSDSNECTDSAVSTPLINEACTESDLSRTRGSEGSTKSDMPASNSDSKECTDSAVSTPLINEARAESDLSRTRGSEESTKSDMCPSNDNNASAGSDMPTDGTQERCTEIDKSSNNREFTSTKNDTSTNNCEILADTGTSTNCSRELSTESGLSTGHKRVVCTERSMSTNYSREVSTESGISLNYNRAVSTESAIAMNCSREVSTEIGISSHCKCEMSKERCIPTKYDREVSTESGVCPTYNREVSAESGISINFNHEVSTESSVCPTYNREVSTESGISMNFNREVSTESGVCPTYNREVSTESGISINFNRGVSTESGISANYNRELSAASGICTHYNREVSTESGMLDYNSEPSAESGLSTNYKGPLKVGTCTSCNSQESKSRCHSNQSDSNPISDEVSAYLFPHYEKQISRRRDFETECCKSSVQSCCSFTSPTSTHFPENHASTIPLENGSESSGMSQKEIFRVWKVAKSPLEPLTKLSKEGPFVTETIEALDKAAEISQWVNSAAVYDLALVYRTIGELGEAKRLLEKLLFKEKMGVFDQIRFSDQLGIVLKKMAEDTSCEERKKELLENSKSMHLMALKCAVENYTRNAAIMENIGTIWNSFHALLEAVERTEQDSAVKLQEKASLFRLIKQHKQSLALLRDIEMLDPQKCSDPEYLKLCIENYVEMQQYDEALVFVELLQCTAQSDRTIELFDDKQFLPRVYFQAAKQAVQRGSPHCRSHFRTLFSSMVKPDSSSSSSSSTSAEDTDEGGEGNVSKPKWDVHILHEETEEDTDVAEQLMSVLTDVCGLAVTRMDDDVKAGIQMEGVLDVMRKSKVVVVMMAGDQKPSGELRFFISMAARRPTSVVLLVNGSHVPKLMKSHRSMALPRDIFHAADGTGSPQCSPQKVAAVCTLFGFLIDIEID